MDTLRIYYSRYLILSPSESKFEFSFSYKNLVKFQSWKKARCHIPKESGDTSIYRLDEMQTTLSKESTTDLPNQSAG